MMIQVKPSPDITFLRERIESEKTPEKRNRGWLIMGPAHAGSPPDSVHVPYTWYFCGYCWVLSILVIRYTTIGEDRPEPCVRPS